MEPRFWCLDIHFIDGASGGYAIAALGLKKQTREQKVYMHMHLTGVKIFSR
ncbi:MAG: DUF3095 family protein [Bdellovibrionales bacterium]